VIIGGESLVSHAGGSLLVGTAGVAGLSGELSRRLGPWRRPLAIHDPGKIVLDLAVAVALGGTALLISRWRGPSLGCSGWWPRIRRCRV
jgi:hypothetical protein